MHRRWIRIASLAAVVLGAGAAVVAARTRTCMSPVCRRDAHGRPIQDGKCCKKPDCSFLRHMEDKMAIHALFRDQTMRDSAMAKANPMGHKAKCQASKDAHDALSDAVEAQMQRDGARSSRTCPGAENSPGLEVAVRNGRCVTIDTNTGREVDPSRAQQQYNVCKEIIDAELAHEKMHLDRCNAKTHDECTTWAAAEEELDGYEIEFGSMYEQLMNWVAGCTGVASDSDWGDARRAAGRAAAELGSRL